MSFDFTELDKVIEQLQKKVLSPGSPPVMYHGHMGIWRTIRGFRVFLELVPGAGRYNFGGKTYKGGRVLVGPPSLTNKDIGNVGNDVWSGLSEKGTKDIFSATPAANGISSLKSSIRNSIAEDDTRNEGLDGLDDKLKLIQLARKTGFTDGEIKEALNGKVFQNAIGNSTEEAAPEATPAAEAAPKDAPKATVTDLGSFKSKKPKKVEETQDEELPQAAGAETTPAGPKAVPSLPQKPSNKPNPANFPPVGAGDSLALVLDTLKVPGLINADKKRKIADDLAAAAKQIKNDIFRKQIEHYAHGLQTGDFKVEEVRRDIKDLLSHRKDRLKAQMSQEDMDKLHDKAVAKDTVKEMRVRAEAAASRPYDKALDESDRAYFEQALAQLASQIRDPKVGAQLIALKSDVKSKRLGGNSLILRILQILRFVLAFIPG